MTKQPEALRLADALDAGENFYAESSLYFDFKLCHAAGDSATELRRLHEVNQELLEALKINLEVLEKVDPYKGQEDLLVDVVSMNKEFIAKATGEQK